MSERRLHAVPSSPIPDEDAAPEDPLLRDLIGTALRRARRAQGRTLREVAEAAQVSLPYLSEIERGRKEPSSEVLAAVNRALGLRLVDLVGELGFALAPQHVADPARASAPGTQALLLAA